MPARRVVTSDEHADLLLLVRQIGSEELAPLVADAEATETFPREVFRMLGQTGLLGLRYGEEYGAATCPTRATSRCSRRLPVAKRYWTPSSLRLSS